AAAGGDDGVVTPTQRGRQVVDAPQPLAYDIEHRRLRIDRVDMAGGADRAREQWREVAGAAAHLSDHLPARETERAHERGRLLPLRALRIELALERTLQLLGCHFFGALLSAPWGVEDTSPRTEATIQLFVKKASLSACHLLHRTERAPTIGDRPTSPQPGEKPNPEVAGRVRVSV